MKLAELVLSHGKETDGTSYPFWAICSKGGLGNIVFHEGIWFNREDAERYLAAKSHRFPKKAFVYCFSGCYSWHMKELYAIAEKETTLALEGEK